MSKFSVKKPLTVLVAVIAVLVLGWVSFTRMTPDLLPNINLPYIIITTTYVGASPEEVELEVSKPLEQTMATLDNIESVSSTSNENYSMVTLEFSESVNMDTITVDILQKINAISGGWDAAVGTPNILKLNPNMLPVMITAVGMENMDIAELSEFMDSTIITKLEGVSGVAGVSASGLLMEEVHVDLSEEKISILNATIYRIIHGTFSEKEEELYDGRSKIQSQLNQLEDGKAALKEGEGMLSKANEAGVGLSQNQTDLAIIQAEMDLLVPVLEMGIEGVDLYLGVLETLLSELNNFTAQQNLLAGDVAFLEEIIADATQLGVLQATLAQRQADIDAIADPTQKADAQADFDANEKPALLAEIARLEAALDEAAPRLAALGIIDPTSPAALAVLGTLRDALDMVGQRLAEITGQLVEENLTADLLPGHIEQVKKERAELEKQLATLKLTQEGLKGGSVMLKDGLLQVENAKTSGILTMANSYTQMIVGEASLTQILNQLDSGMEQLDAALETALKQADLKNMVTVQMITTLLGAQNFQMPAGSVTGDGTSYQITAGNTIDSFSELQNLILFDLGMDDLDAITLSDVADVYMTDNSGSIYANIDGNNGVLLTFSKQSNYSTAEAADNLLAAFESLEAQYEGLHFTALMNQGDYIYLVVNSVIENLLWGAVLAVIVLLLFLRDLRPTFITLCSIPVSIVFAFVLMYFSGVTLNMLSLSGLAVAVGMLVDNSVVVIENIYRLRGKGYSAVQAAVSGAGQVAGAIAASTLTTICIFLPIVFIEGLTRQLFTDFALTFAYALIASLVIALTLVPAMSSRMLNNVKEKDHKLMDKAMRGYTRILKWVLNHKLPVLAGTLALLLLSGVLVLQRGFTFMPSMETGELTVSVTMPEEVEFTEAAETADQIVERIGGIDGVETVGAMMGGGSALSIMGMGGGGGSGSTSVTMYVLLDDNTRRSADDISKEILEKTADLDCEVSASGSSSMDISMLSGNGVTVRLYGENLDDMRSAASGLGAVLRAVEGVGEVSDGIQNAEPAIRIEVNREKAMEYGLTVAQVYQEIATSALLTSNSSASVTFDGKSYAITVESPNADKLSPGYLRTYSFTVTDRMGEDKTVFLADIADFIDTEALSSIRRADGNRYVSISAEIAEGYNVSLVARDIEKAVNAYSLPGGLRVEYSGENETIMESMADLMMMLLLGVVLVYLIMVAQFQSLKSPFIVMFTIPLAFTGGLLALFITGFEISIISLIGFVMLVGIIVNNGIVLVDYINQLRAEGVPTRQALLEAGVTRMRPILMTTITTVFGLVTMAFGLGAGAALMQPIAIVCIGGLIYATLLTLFVVPAIYEMLNRKDMKVISEDELQMVDD